LLGGGDLEVYLVDLDGLLRTTTKKRSSTFMRRKVHPRQNPGYAYDEYMMCLLVFETFVSSVQESRGKGLGGE